MILKGYEKLELSTQIIIKEALERGVEVEVLDLKDNFIRLKKGNTTEYIKQATKTSKDTYIAPLIMENKEVTKLVLREHGLSVPNGKTIHSADEAISVFEQFLNKDIVVKPKSTNFGKGISIMKNINDFKDFESAVIQALRFDSSVLIEEFISGREFRFLIINDIVEAILHRIPANVEGNGIQTVKELVNEKNKDPLRGKGYVTPLEKIQLGKTEKEYLRLQGKDINYIPKKGEIVYLRENSNISTGGDSIDYTDEIHEGYSAIAVIAAKAVGAKICGGDIIIKDIYARPDSNNYSIIELNFNPALHIHDFPYRGKSRGVGKKVLDMLGFLV